MQAVSLAEANLDPTSEAPQALSKEVDAVTSGAPAHMLCICRMLVILC